MISSKDLAKNVNDRIDQGSITELEFAQLTGVDPSIKTAKLVVDTLTSLPSAVDNKGRMAFVQDVEEHYFSDGVEWINDYNTEPNIFKEEFYIWGENDWFQYNDGTQIAKSSPIIMNTDGLTWKFFTAGQDNAGAITTDGILYMWGRNIRGTLGDGTTIIRSSPVTVIGNITDWKQLSLTYDFNPYSIGLTESGLVYSWGANNGGRLGDNTGDDKSSPVLISGGITNWDAISSGGGRNNSAITTDNILYMWGGNTVGQLGDGTTTDRSSPVTVIGGITNWKQTVGGTNHNLGLTIDNIAYAWGQGSSGQLGDNTVAAKSSPVTIAGGITNWKQLSAGGSFSSGVTLDGIIYTWGSNTSGRLGNNSTSNSSSPVTIVGGITNWKQVMSSDRHTLALTEDGLIYTWGSNSNGSLGLNDSLDRSSPTLVVGGINNWSSISQTESFNSIALATTSKGFE